MTDKTNTPDEIADVATGFTRIVPYTESNQI